MGQMPQIGQHEAAATVQQFHTPWGSSRSSLWKAHRPDHVLADSLCIAFALCPDFAVDVEACMAPVEDLLHQRKADELFPQEHGEDLMGEDFLDDLVMETTDMVKSTIQGCASFGHQDVDMGMEVDAAAEGLDHGHHSRHKLKTCGCAQFMPILILKGPVGLEYFLPQIVRNGSPIDNRPCLFSTVCQVGHIVLIDALQLFMQGIPDIGLIKNVAIGRGSDGKSIRDFYPL